MTLAPPHPSTRRARSTRSGPSGLFRALWRWHFYASFLVVPVLLLLAVTGLVYLFRFQLEPLLHPDLMKVSAPSDTAITQPYANQLAAVERAHPDATVVSMAEPREDGRSTVFSVTTEDGAARDVFVNPYGAEVLGSLDPDRTVSGIAVLLHGELMSGRVGDLVIELGACWAIVMALTGYYLFVRGWKARRRRTAKGAPGARLRSRHGLVGAFVGVGLLLLLVSGLPWTGLWGEKVQQLATAQGSSLWSEDHGALSDPTSSLDESLPHSHSVEVPWGMGESRGAAIDGARRGRRGAQRRQPRHRRPRRVRRRAAAPDDDRPARGGGGRLLRDRLRLRRPVRRAHRAHRPVRRRGRLDVRLRRLPAARRGWSRRGSACTRGARSAPGRWSDRH